MQQLKHLLLITVISIIPCSVMAIVAPKDGGKLPQSYLDMKAQDPTAFTMKRAWIQKTRRLQELRRAYLAQRLAGGASAPVAMPPEYATSGILRVPVFLCAFNNIAAPFDSVTMQNNLFDNNPTGSITEYYDEVSYGNVMVSGTVYASVLLAQSDVVLRRRPGLLGLVQLRSRRPADHGSLGRQRLLRGLRPI